MVFGYATSQHAAKIPAWALRLRSAHVQLARAVVAKDRSAVLQHYADTWFWIGRITGDLIAAGEDKRYWPQVQAATKEITAAQPALWHARAFLSGGFRVPAA